MQGTCQCQNHVQVKTKKHPVRMSAFSRSEPRPFLDKAMSRPGLGYGEDHVAQDQVKTMLRPGPSQDQEKPGPSQDKDTDKTRTLTRPGPGQNMSRQRPCQVRHTTFKQDQAKKAL